MFSFPKTLHIYDNTGNEALTIQRKLLTFLPHYRIYRGDTLAAEVVKEFSFFTPRYYISGTPLTVEGNFTAHDYDIMKNGMVIANITKEWFTWGDSYVVHLNNDEDESLALAIVIVIDCVLDSNN